MLLLIPCQIGAKALQISLIKDGPGQKDFLSEAGVKQEIIDLLGSEFDVSFTPAIETTGDWTLAGINNVIERQYNNPKVTMIVTIGAVSSNEIAKREQFPKPTMAAVTINPAAQSFPIKDNRSAKKNFTFIADVKTAGHEVEFFRDFVQARVFAVLIGPLLAESWPQFKTLLAEAEKAYQVKFIQVPTTSDPQAVVNSIPSNVEAVLLGVLSKYSDAQIQQLAQGLIKRKLPSYSFLGEEGVNAGYMVSINQTGPARLQIARRVAINVQRILLGTPAQNLNVNMRFAERVIYNQATGLAIGFAPKWDDIINAKIINQQQYGNRKAFTIQAAVAHALKNNLNLQAAAIDKNLARENLAIARSNLWPSLSLNASYTQINDEQTILGANPEKRGDAQLELGQLLYSESVHANVDINQLLIENQDAEFQTTVLDTAQSVATAYLNVLRAKADEGIRRSNLEVTRKNLELAENRLRVGASGKSDILRWQSQLANERKNLFISEANRRNADLELARVINLPPGTLVDSRQPAIDKLLGIVSDERFNSWVSNEIQWRAFQAFYIQEAITHSTLLRQFDALIAVSQRELLANDRGHYIPDVSAFGQFGRNFHQSGLGALDDYEEDSWTLGLQASLNFDLSGSRRRTSNQKKLTIKQLNLQRASAVQQIETITGQALFNVGASFPGIELSYDSAKAASDSLALVRNAYAKGRVSISDLLDAQNNALSAQLVAADSEYAFLQDFVALMRAAYDFDPLVKGKYSKAWFDRLIAFFQAKGITVKLPQE